MGFNSAFKGLIYELGIEVFESLLDFPLKAKCLGLSE